MNKTIKKTVKDILKWSTRLYLASYLAVSVHVGYDFVRYNLPRLEQRQTVQILEIHKYQVNIDGKNKQLTLAGENHLYNYTEHEIAKKLVEEYQHFANECGDKSSNKMSIINLSYGIAVSIPLSFTYLYQNLGDGRWYSSIGGLAKEKGYKVDALEDVNNFLDNLSTKEKISLFGEMVYSGLTAPLAYYEGKYELPYDASGLANFSYREALIDSRDKVMAKGIIDLLKKDEIDKLLANVGRAHLEGIIANLSEQVELQEVK